MKYYVVSDPHGYCTYLKKALEEAGFFDETEPCKLIVCGDLLDRGSEAQELISFMLELMEKGRLIYILGNHEELLVQCLQEISRGGVYEIACGMSHHFLNRTWDSLLQISEMSEAEAYRNPYELVRRVMRSTFYKRLLPTCVDYYETPRYIFTHGWIPCMTSGVKPYTRYTYNPDWRNADVTDWQRARWFNGMELACRHHVKEPDKTIVCGHWHTSYGHSKIAHSGSEWGADANFAPFAANGILAIDASTPNSRRVNCVVIED
ncbi:MAG: hypothetical protein E7620_02800 [Ruminococcaceae bacterium]|nr:hypothetical protein [Oscillospiraceae bacterium]